MAVKYWNGVADDSRLVHLAAVYDPGKTETEWFESVNDEQYAEAN